MKNNKIVINIPPPRNPTVVEMLKKNAGSHEKPYKSKRVKTKISLKKIDLDKY